MEDRVAEIAATADFGTASARKTGRNPKWPFVPVILHGERQAQIKGLAYATREEAVASAQRHIDAQRRTLARQLTEPRYRALREQYGLPRDI